MHYKYKMNVWNSGKDKFKKVKWPPEKRERFPEGKNKAIAKNKQEKWPSNFTTGEETTEEHKEKERTNLR